MLRRLWHSRPGVSVRTFFEVYGIVSGASALGLGTVLAVIIPALVQEILNLSLLSKIMLGVGVFLVASAIALGVTKAVLGWLAATKTKGEEGAGPQSLSSASDSFLLQEVKRLRSENERIGAENKAEVEELKAERDRLKPHANRMRLRLELRGYYLKGERLRSSEPTGEDEDALEKWKDEVTTWDMVTYGLIQTALGDHAAALYSNQAFYASTDQSRSPEWRFIAMRLERLANLLNGINGVDRMPLCPDFDEKDYFGS